MAWDLVFGRTTRDWSIGSVPVPAPVAPTREEVLEQEIRSGPPVKPAQPSAKELVMSRLKEASPEAMALYDKYRPTYRDHQLVVRTKI